MTELVQKLRPYVSVFSAALPERKIGDRVVVGGVVTGFVNIGQLFEGTEAAGYSDEGVYVTLDDAIGEVEVCLHQHAYRIYEKNHGPIQLGDVILAEGLIGVVDTTHTFKGPMGKRITTDIHKEDTRRVLSYQAAPLPDVAPQEQQIAE